MEHIGRRMLHSLVSLMLLFTLVFVMIRSVPGDPARLMAGISASDKVVSEIRSKMGLDQPIWTQYGKYLLQLTRGDLGQSTRNNRPVVVEIGRRFPATLQLALVGMLVATALGLAAGVMAATRHNSILDGAVTSAAVAANSLPAFWLALMLIDGLAVRGRLLPSSGYGSWKHLMMPALVIAATQVGMIGRLTRSSLVEVLRSDYIRTAVAKGLPGRVIIWRHALRNALIPTITVMGLQMGLLLGGAVVTETIFRWPGVGRLLVEAVLNRDYPVIQGLVLLFGLTFIILNLIVDVVTVLIDPRVRKAR